MDMEEKQLDRKVIFKGHVVELVVDKVLCPNGRESSREIINHPGGACVLAITENNEVIMEKQFRYAYGDVIYELPAGKLEYGENPAYSAARELEEETGYKSNSKLVSLGQMYPTCGYSSEVIYCYLATDLVKTETNLDVDEVIELVFIPLKEVLDMISKNIIKDGKTVFSINNYLLKTNKIKL